MNKSEYISTVENYDINHQKVEQIEAIYKTKVSGFLAKAISFADNSIFIEDEKRVLAFSEIIQLDKDYENTFTTNGLIPIIDCYDGVFIVFIVSESMWAKYSTSDMSIFKKRPIISELI